MQLTSPDSKLCITRVCMNSNHAGCHVTAHTHTHIPGPSHPMTGKYISLLTKLFWHVAQSLCLFSQHQHTSYACRSVRLCSDIISIPTDTLSCLQFRKTSSDMMSTPTDTLSCLQIRKTLFDMMSMPTGYGVTVGMAANTISSLRGNVSAMASNTTPPNYADEGITTVSSLDKVVNKRCYKVQCMGCYKFVSYGWEITCLTLLSPVFPTQSSF